MSTKRIHHYERAFSNSANNAYAKKLKKINHIRLVFSQSMTKIFFTEANAFLAEVINCITISDGRN